MLENTSIVVEDAHSKSYALFGFGNKRVWFMASESFMTSIGPGNTLLWVSIVLGTSKIGVARQMCQGRRKPFRV